MKRRLNKKTLITILIPVILISASIIVIAGDDGTSDGDLDSCSDSPLYFVDWSRAAGIETRAWEVEYLESPEHIIREFEQCAMEVEQQQCIHITDLNWPTCADSCLGFTCLFTCQDTCFGNYTCTPTYYCNEICYNWTNFWPTCGLTCGEPTCSPGPCETSILYCPDSEGSSTTPSEHGEQGLAPYGVI